MFKPTYDQIHVGSTVSILIGGDREVQGMVEEVLHHENHPSGVEVRLMDGRIGRVQRVIESGVAPQHPPGTAYGGAHTQEPSAGHFNSRSNYSNPPAQTPWQSSNQEYAPPATAPPPRASRPAVNNLDEFPVDGQERSEQFETMQNYEAQVHMSQDDMNQATLQREFPNIDASLIAAIYGDSRDLASTREMLQELS